MSRRCFYSFHYKPDNWRSSQVRNIGTVEGNKPISDNDWETVTKGGDSAIKKWIKEQMKGRSCTIVLAGTGTANRKWINHEIIESWNDGMGVAAIHINGLKNSQGQTSSKGGNPLDHVTFKSGEKKLSSVAKCYTPTGATSQQKYDWIKKNLAAIADEAAKIRKNN